MPSLLQQSLAAAILLSIVTLANGASPDNTHVIVDRARILTAVGQEQLVVGGKIAVSNLSPFAGFHVVGEIKAAPTTGQWVDVPLDNHQTYRYARYEAPPGSHGGIVRLEFYAGNRKLGGAGFGSIGGGQAWKKAFDPKVTTIWQTKEPDGQFVGLDFQEQATPWRPLFNPPAGVFANAQKVTLQSRTPGITIRYTIDGTLPTATNGTVYSGPIDLTTTTSLEAVSFQKGLAPSPASFGVYSIGAPAAPELHTLHVGNSLTGSTRNFALYASTAGYPVKYASFLHGGATTKMVWDDTVGVRKAEWEKLFGGLSHLDEFTLQPRDFNINEEADYDIRFLKLVRQNSPEVQPWLYAEWVEQDRLRPTDLGKEPTSEMKKVWPAQTWEESMAAMVLYVEDLQAKVAQMDPGQPPPHIIPSALAMGWIHRMIEKGQVPGIPPGTFYQNLFEDVVHPKAEGQYLDDLTWFSAFYGKPPEGVLPIGTQLTLEQAAIMRKLAWDVVKNYPGSGLYKEGTTPVGPPQFSPGPPKGDITPMELTSSTPGAWFRYTLDGTTPTRTRGYVYCGIISLQPDMQLQAIAYKSGMADSAPVAYYAESTTGK